MVEFLRSHDGPVTGGGWSLNHVLALGMAAIGGLALPPLWLAAFPSPDHSASALLAAALPPQAFRRPEAPLPSRAPGALPGV